MAGRQALRGGMTMQKPTPWWFWLALGVGIIAVYAMAWA
jgi:hypothetical protein